MRYFQPYGVSDPNAGYTNGNPTTGTMGSIPPAGSIEHPQREIVNLIKDAGLVPNEADLAQLSKGVQSGKIIYGADTGSENVLSVALSRAPDALAVGLLINVKLANAITGPTTINVNGFGAVPVVHGDGTPMRKGDAAAGQMLCLLFDGARFQVVGGVSGFGDNVSGIRTKLTGNITLYISRTGDDVTGDGTLAKPWRTRTFAWYRAQAIYDLVYSYTLTFQMLDGNYDEAKDSFQANGVFVGSTGPASIIFQGNMANPALCVITVPAGGAGWSAAGLAAYRIQGFTINGFYGILATIYGWISIGPNNVFANCPHAHIAADVAGTVQIDNSYTIIQGSEQHFLASTASFIFCQGSGVVITLVGAGLNFSVVFCGALSGAQMSLPGSMMSFVGTATGTRYIASTCGVIITNGAGPNFFPGNAAGATAFGGQYV